jgi:hypothetical protein
VGAKGLREILALRLESGDRFHIPAFLFSSVQVKYIFICRELGPESTEKSPIRLPANKEAVAIKATEWSDKGVIDSTPMVSTGVIEPCTIGGRERHSVEELGDDARMSGGTTEVIETNSLKFERV